MGRTTELTLMLSLLSSAGAAQSSDEAAPRVRGLLATATGADVAAALCAAADLQRMGAVAVPHIARALKTTKDRKAQERLVDVLVALRAHGESALVTLCGLPSEPKTIQPRLVLSAIDAIAPYAPRRHKAIEEVLMTAFVKRETSGPIKMVHIGRGHFTIVDITRSLRRLELDVQSDTAELQSAVVGDDPFWRELAAELLALRGPRAAAALPALLTAFAAEHPRKSTFEFVTGDVAFGGTFDAGNEIPTRRDLARDPRHRTRQAGADRRVARATGARGRTVVFAPGDLVSGSARHEGARRGTPPCAAGRPTGRNGGLGGDHRVGDAGSGGSDCCAYAGSDRRGNRPRPGSARGVGAAQDPREVTHWDGFRVACMGAVITEIRVGSTRQSGSVIDLSAR